MHRNVHVPQLARHSTRTVNNRTGFDHATTEAGTDDRRDGRAMDGIGTEMPCVRVQRRGIAVVVVDDREMKVLLDRAAEVEAPPLAIRKVGGPLSGDDAARTGRPGRREPDGEHGAGRGARNLQGELHRSTDLLRSPPLGPREHDSAFPPFGRPRTSPSPRERWHSSWYRQRRVRPRRLVFVRSVTCSGT